MTPTLVGRWQTRILLLGTLGVLISLGFGYFGDDYRTPLIILGAVLVCGLVWDAVYQYLQRYRWDRDWPPAFQVAAGIAEALLVWGLVQAARLLAIDLSLTIWQFLAHYTLVWSTTFIVAQGPLRLLLPRWRFRGGQLF